MGTLFLIRHGQASYGEADYDRLSPRGARAGARARRGTSRRSSSTRVYAGPLRRQQQTIALATRGGGRHCPAATTLAELAEYPAFEMLQHFMPRLVAEDPKFAALTTGADAAAARRRVPHDPRPVDARRVARSTASSASTAFAARVRAGLERVVARGELGRADRVRDLGRADRRRGRPRVRHAPSDAWSARAS